MGKFDSVLTSFADRNAKIEDFFSKVEKAAEELREGLKDINAKVVVFRGTHSNGWETEIMIMVDEEPLALCYFKPRNAPGVTQIVEECLNRMAEKLSKFPG